MVTPIKPFYKTMSEIDEQVTEETLDTQEEESLNDSVEGEDLNARIAELEEQLKKKEELANNYKVRAEKAEKGVKPKVETAQVSLQDQYALLQSNVALEDLDDVQEFAKFKKITIAEALKSPVLKNILAGKKEERESAAAANISASKRTSNKITDDVILSKASKGELPQTAEEAERLFKLRKGIK